MPNRVNSVSELHTLLSLPRPQHPLVSLVRFEDIKPGIDSNQTGTILDFYTIAVKKGFKGKMKYGQRYYDFDAGILSFIAPEQLVKEPLPDDYPPSGWALFVHPDFLRSYPLSKAIKNYGYFSYDVNEALHLSEKEESIIEDIVQNIEREYHSNLDNYSQDVMVSNIELLLNYANRFYNRQFITRKHVIHDLLTDMENLLDDYFNSEDLQKSGIPTVKYLSGKLNISPNYLGDMLRSLTGKSTQEHIHEKLIEKAKEALTGTSLSVSEIAYQLGFGYPQSFSKLFKNKTKVSPVNYRNNFN